ncbi:MAG: hypothetical protein IKG92_07990 [Bacteroidales bacterium]|nr:hypothetical protein [Bacteroidales bacterium]
MESSDLRREENYNEFLRLCQNNDYLDVTFDEESGGVSAVHRFHKFDKQKGVFADRRGDYERKVLEILRKNGDRIILESEISSEGNRICDGLLNDIPVEIKAIEGLGTWSISTKLLDAEQQHAKTVIFYFPNKDLYSENRVNEGIRLANSSPKSKGVWQTSNIIIAIGEQLETGWNKKATPIEGWSVLEGLRGQNGANPFTIPPSDAKLLKE